MPHCSKSKVAVIFNQKQLGLLLRENPPNNMENNLFIDFSMENIDIGKLSDKAEFKKISRTKPNLVNQKAFIQEYNTLIGDIGRKNNNRLWWASAISSKNPYSSKLSILLENYISVLRVIDKEKYDYLIIYNSDWILLNIFKKIFSQRGDNFIYFDYRIKLWFRLKLNIIKQITSIIRNALGTCEKIYLARKELGSLAKRKICYGGNYYVIKSNIFEGSFDKNNNYNDIFFGVLPRYLKPKKNIIVLVNIMADYRNNLKRIKKQSEFLIIPVDYFLSYFDVLKSVMELLLPRISINRLKKFFCYDVTKLIRTELKRTNMGISPYEYLHYNCMKNLSKRISIEEYLFTYENNPWEKMSVMALREFSKHSSIIGYQHTIVVPACSNNFISCYEKEIMPLPDKILTVGETAKSILEEYGEYGQNLIESSCSLRYEYLFNISMRRRRRRTGNILLALDGVPEICRMVDFVVGELKGDRNYQLTIRPHPVFLPKDFKHKLKYNVDDFPNITISTNNSVIEDFSLTDIVIYWGSTLSLEAISMGIPVIHYDDMKFFLSNDPLFQLNHFKWGINNSDSLVNRIEEIYSMHNDNFVMELKKAKKYINRYFHPITEDSLNKFTLYKSKTNE